MLHALCSCCTRRRGAWRLRLADGTCVFLEFHPYMGPFLFRDRDRRREIEDWWERPLMVAAIDWFVERGKVA